MRRLDGFTLIELIIVIVLLAIVAAALGVIGGVILAMQPGERTEANSRYVTPEVRREHVHEDLADNPDSGRVLWDALDAGVDPTEVDEAERVDANREAKNTPKGDGQTKG